MCSHDDRRNSNSNAASVCPPIIPPHDDRTTIKVPASAGQSKTIKDPQRTQTQTPFQPISHRHGPNPVTLNVKYNRALTAAHGKSDIKLKANGIRLGYAAPGLGKVCVPLTLSAKLGRAILKNNAIYLQLELSYTVRFRRVVVQPMPMACQCCDLQFRRR